MRRTSPARSSSSSYRVLQEPGGGSSWSPFQHDGQGSHSRFEGRRRGSAGSALSGGQRVAPPNFLQQRGRDQRAGGGQQGGGSKLLQTAHVRTGGGGFRSTTAADGAVGIGGSRGSRGFAQMAQETSKERMERLKNQLAQAKAEEEMVRAQRLSMGGRNAFIDAREQQSRQFERQQEMERHELKRLQMERMQLERNQHQHQRYGGRKQGSPAFIGAAAAAAVSSPSPARERRTSSGGVSSNVFATGSSQNCGNFITDRPTTRVVAPPGGRSSGPLW